MKNPIGAPFRRRIKRGIRPIDLSVADSLEIDPSFFNQGKAPFPGFVGEARSLLLLPL